MEIPNLPVEPEMEPSPIGVLQPPHPTGPPIPPPVGQQPIPC